VQQADREGRTGSHAAAAGEVAAVVDLDAALDFQVAQGFTDGGVGDLLDRVAEFDF
jgi:hypothetical protein